MTMRKIFGALLVALPFVALLSFVAIDLGIGALAFVLAPFVVTAIIGAGLYLMVES